MVDNTQQDVARQAREAVQHSGRATSEAARRGAEFAADATRRVGEVAADAVDRTGRVGSYNIRQGTQDLAESQQQIVQNAAEQFEQLSRKVAQAVQGTSEDVRSLMALPGTARGGLQDLQQGVSGLIEGVVRTNLRATQEFFRLANPGAYIELQHRFVRQYLDTLIENSVSVVRAVRRTADETLGPLEQQLQHRHSARQDEGHAYRQAAE
ncbi:MAG: phasin family protein [Acetobacteraceae bacterium]|nr:phasin family protein [Acetobacteraceae bacterium]